MPHDAVRRAREEAGLSRAALATRMGCSWETIRRAEEGRDPRLSTLGRMLGAMPASAPGDLLGLDGRHAPVASPAAWRFHRDVLGHVVRRVTVTCAPDGDRRIVSQSWQGVRGLRFDLADPDDRTSLLRAVVAAPADVLREVVAHDDDLRGRSRRFVGGGAEHELRFGRPLVARGFSYAVTRTRDRQPPDPAVRAACDAGTETLAIDLDAAIERLVFVVEGPAPWMRLFVAPQGALPPEGAFRLAESLHPRGALVTRSGSSVAITIAHPMPHLRYGIAWRADAAPGFEAPRARLGAPSPLRHAGDALRAARSAEGLSSRELSRRIRVSAATTVMAERGDDARASTWRRLVTELPALVPARLLADAEPRVGMTASEAWTWQRGVHGLVAERASRSVIVDAEGNATERMALRGLRRLREGDGEIVVRDAIARTVAGRVGPVLVEGGGSASPLRIRWQRVAGEQDEFHLVIPPTLTAHGAAFTRTERKSAAYKTRPDHARRSIGPAFECLVPSERLELEVRLPALRGADVRAFARAAVAVTTPRWPDLAREIHPSGWDFEWDPAARRARLVVLRPLLGVRYSIAWRLP